MQQKDSNKIFTYQTRLPSFEGENFLSQSAAYFSKIERTLFKDFSRGKKILSLKNAYLEKYKITARQFNAIRITLEGKIQSYKKGLVQRISLLKTKIEHLKKKISRLKNFDKKHQKKRRLFFLETKLAQLEKEKKVKICFGGKKLFSKQFYLKENGYTSHEEWKAEYRKVRDSTFFLIGSKDEHFGNQSCQLRKENNSFSLLIRLPNLFPQKYVEIKDINFAYGKEEIEKCLEENERRKRARFNKEPYAHLGKAINYRFLKDEKGWRIFVSIEQRKAPTQSKEQNGSLGIDFNVGHLAVAETDRFGNIVHKMNIPCVTYGKTKNQRVALINEACKKVVDYAKGVEKPLVMEALNFQNKKQSLREGSKKQSRMLSSFAYHQTFESMESKAFREGISIFTVNPAYSTVIGELKFKRRYGLSSHHSAALVIARRKDRYSEIPSDCIEVYKENTETAFSLPERNREKHVWCFYREVSKRKKAAHGVHLSTKRSSEKRDSEKASVGYGCNAISKSLTKLLG